MSKCRNCKNNTLREEDGEQYSWCVVKHDNLDIGEERECEHFKQATRADQIRASNDVDLEFLLVYSPFRGRFDEARKWLKQEAT